MADQHFDRERNRFRLDLHACSTAEASDVVARRLDECYRYAVATLEIIFGTPDRFEGSIEQSVQHLIDGNPRIAQVTPIHAGIVLSVEANPTPLPRDEDMCFAGFHASYQGHFRAMSFERDLFPFRTILDTGSVASDLGCPAEYVRAVAADLSSSLAESVREWNEDTRRNETTWRITRSGHNAIRERWHRDIAAIDAELLQLGATPVEIEAIHRTFRTPLRDGASARPRASASLARLRRRSRSA